jgi:hypothetical protein
VILRDIKHGVLNLIKWFPIIWQDRDWDQHFLYEMLKFKLEQMENFQRKYGIGLYRDKYADQMRVCINLLGRLIDDNYSENTFQYHDEKWGELSLETKPHSKDLVSLHVVREKAVSDEEKKQESKEFMRLTKHAGKLRVQDIEMLFLNMTKYIEGWWD